MLRLLTLLIFIGGFAAPSSATAAAVSVAMNDTKLEVALDGLAHQFQRTVVIDDSVDKSVRVTVNIVVSGYKEAFDEVCKKYNLTWREDEHEVITVSKAKAPDPKK